MTLLFDCFIINYSSTSDTLTSHRNMITLLSSVFIVPIIYASPTPIAVTLPLDEFTLTISRLLDVHLYSELAILFSRFIVNYRQAKDLPAS